MLALGAVPALAVTRTPYSTNLVKNPGFEAGYANAGYQPIAVPYWSTSENMTVVRYGAPNGFPSLAEGTRISGGKKFFTIGTPQSGWDFCPGAAKQNIPIRRRAAAIDAGRVKMELFLYMGTYGFQPDTAVALLRALDAGGNVLGEIRLTTTDTNGHMDGRGGRDIVPAGTRSLRVYLYSQETQGYCDAYFDRVSVKISPII